MSSLLINVWVFFGAISICVASAAGALIVEHYHQERRRLAMLEDMDRLLQRISVMQVQMDSLKRHSVESGKKPKRYRAKDRHADTADEDTSVIDSSDMEFFDISDDDTKSSNLTRLHSRLKEIDEKLQDFAQVNDAFSQLESILQDFPSCSDVLWRIGKARYRMSLSVKEVASKLVHLNAGVSSCHRALELAPNCGESHKWYAIVLGACLTHKGIREKLKDSADFKRHVEKAILLMPDDSTSHYLLGRYTMEMAGLSWLERKAIATFDKQAECTFEDALRSLLTAHRLGREDWKVNKFCIGKCYAAVGKFKDAIKWLDEAKAIEVSEMGDEDVDVELDELVQKYSSYR